MHRSMRFILAIVFLFINQFASAQTERIDFYTKKFQSFRLGRIDSMKYYAAKLKEFAKESDSKKALIRHYNALGIIEEEQGYYENAMLRYDSALYYATQITDSLEIGRVYQLRGVVYREQGKYDQAIDYLTIASRIAYAHDDPELQALCYMNLSSIFNYSKDYKSAKKYAQQSILLSKSNLSQFSSMGGAYVELGNYYMQNNNLDSAAIAYESAKVFFQHSSISDGISTAANNLGVIYYYQGNYQKAIDNFMETYAQAEKANDRKNMALGLMNAGDTYTAMGSYDQAEHYLNRSLDIFKEVGNRIYLRDVYEYLTLLKTKRGDYKSALYFNQLSALYKDSLFNESMATKIASIQTQYETEKKDREIKLLELEAKAKQQQMIYVVIVFVFLILAIVLFYGRRSYKMKAQIEEEKKRLQQERFRLMLDAEEGERKRIARELHDGLGQLLVTTRLLISATNETATNSRTTKAMEILDSSISEVRAISHRMMPPALEKLGLFEAVGEMVNSLNASGMITALLEGELPDSLDELSSISIYRSIQEIVNNALKYSQASRLNIAFVANHEVLTITVSDNGKGFDVSKNESSGLGMNNVYSRMELIGGSVQVYSQPNEGTRVRMSIILNKQIRRSA